MVPSIRERRINAVHDLPEVRNLIFALATAAADLTISSISYPSIGWGGQSSLASPACAPGVLFVKLGKHDPNARSSSPSKLRGILCSLRRVLSAPESGGGFPGSVCPVGPSPKVPGRLAGGFVSGGARRWRQPSVGTISRPVGAPSAPHPTWTPPPIQCRRDRLQKGEGYIPLPHHVTPRPSQIKAAQSSKDYCGLT